jgi:DNA repair protein RecO (recombination protein O)
MPAHKTEAIVLQSMDFGERDKLITLLTKRYGKLKGIAKGAKKSKKRFAGTLEIFSYVSLNFFEKENLGLARIEGVSLIEPFSKINESIEKVTYGSYFVELANEMVGEREENKAIFSLLLYFLRLLNREKVNEDYVRIFEVRLLTLLGYQPQLEKCLICETELGPDTVNWFSLKRGGVVCPKCHRGIEDIPISLGTSRILKAARSYPLSKIKRIRFTAQASKESRQILSNFVEYQLGKRLKSLQFLEQVKGV